MISLLFTRTGLAARSVRIYLSSSTARATTAWWIWIIGSARWVGVIRSTWRRRIVWTARWVWIIWTTWRVGIIRTARCIWIVRTTGRIWVVWTARRVWIVWSTRRIVRFLRCIWLVGILGSRGVRPIWVGTRAVRRPRTLCAGQRSQIRGCAMQSPCR